MDFHSYYFFVGDIFSAYLVTEKLPQSDITHLNLPLMSYSLILPKSKHQNEPNKNIKQMVAIFHLKKRGMPS